ncbi:MAG: WYL domain-containing protein [Actinobacteria bacterium]|nr:WYL domain-containing protein [Actinomycetota bacterium]
MTAPKSNTERLLNLLALLTHRSRPLTLKEIRRELSDCYPGSDQAARAKFERDKSVLRSLGVPIQTVVLGGEQAGESAYSVDRREYELADLRLSADEQDALQLALATVRIGARAGTEALWKLGGERLLGTTTSVDLTIGDDALVALSDGVLRQQCVRFRYHGQERTVDPFGLLCRAGRWYLVGHDHLRGDQRVFRVDRIEGSASVQGPSRVPRPAGLDLARAVKTDKELLGEGTTARVLVDAEFAATVEREMGSRAVLTRNRDGSAEFAVPCGNLDAFRTWVLAMVHRAEVLGPADVRAHVVEWLEDLSRRRGRGASAAAAPSRRPTARRAPRRPPGPAGSGVCGVPPYTPDLLVDVWIEPEDGTDLDEADEDEFQRRLASGTIHAEVPTILGRPARLTSAELFGLVAMLKTALALPGADAGGPLARVYDKIVRLAGDGTSGVEVVVAVPPHLAAVRAAVDSGERLRIDYRKPFAALQGARSRDPRTIVPRAVFEHAGNWYVTADDDRSGERRDFRVDRIASLEGTGERVAVEPVVPHGGSEWFLDAESEATVVVAPGLRWLVEPYPYRDRSVLADGSMRVTLAVSSDHWLGRLLVRGGRSITLVSPARYSGLQADTAAAVLARYVRTRTPAKKKPAAKKTAKKKPSSRR